MADISWRDTKANFSGANQAMAGASASMSAAGNIFDRLGAQLRADRQAQLESDLKERQLAEQIRQFDLNLGEGTRRFDTSHALDTRKQDFTELSGNRDFLAGREDEEFDRQDKRLGRLLEAGKTEDTVYGRAKDLMGLQRPNSQGSSSTSVGSTGSRDFSELIRKNSFDYGVPEFIINSVANIESSGNPNAKSPTGVEGLMQVTKDTTRAMGFDPNDRTNPENSIAAGTKYLGKLFSQYGNWQDALVAYNGGDGAVQYIKTGQADPKWVEALQKAGVTDIPGKLREVQNYAQKANQISQEFEAQGGMGAFNMGRQDAIRQQNDVARFMADREVAMASLQDTINSPYATPDRRIDAQARFDQLMGQVPTNSMEAPTQNNTASNSTNSTNTGSPLLGLTNSYQDRIDQMIANGDSPSGDILDKAAKRDAEIAKEEATERQRLTNNDVSLQLLSDFDGDVARAKDAYEDWYSRTNGEKASYYPLEGALNAQKKDEAWRKSIEEGDKKAIAESHKSFESFYKEFMKDQVDKGSTFSYGNNITRAAMSNVFGNDPAKLDALRGLIARSVYVDNTGDKTGWIFDGRDDKFSTTWNQFGDSVAPALEALANFDPDRTSFQDLPPVAQRILKDAATYGFLDKKVADTMALRTGERAQAVDSERTRKATTKTTSDPKAQEEARYKALVDKLDQDTSRMADTGLISGLASIPRGGKAPKTSSVIQDRWSSLSRARYIHEPRKGRKLTDQEVLLFGTDTDNRLQLFESKIDSLQAADKKLSDRQAAEKALKWMKEEFKEV